MPENLAHIETLARAHTDAAIKTLAEIMRDPSAPARVRSEAAAVLRRFLRRFPGVATPLVTGERLGHFSVKPKG